jgi:hypothetical protein
MCKLVVTSASITHGGKGVESGARADRRIDLARRKKVLMGRIRCACA